MTQYDPFPDQGEVVFARPILAVSFLLSSHSGAVIPHHPRRLVTPSQWSRVVAVHRCEEPSSWHVNGPMYQGGLGWLHSTWLAYRAPWMPWNAAMASPQEQAWAMVRFVSTTLHWWPDSLGCTGGY